MDQKADEGTVLTVRAAALQSCDIINCLWVAAAPDTAAVEFYKVVRASYIAAIQRLPSSAYMGSLSEASALLGSQSSIEALGWQAWHTQLPSALPLGTV